MESWLFQEPRLFESTYTRTGDKNETFFNFVGGGRWQFRSMDADYPAARAPYHYLCACDYVGYIDDLGNYILW